MSAPKCYIGPHDIDNGKRESVVSDLDDLVEDLKRARDELRVQIHLASKEAQYEWHPLEEKMDGFAPKAKLEETGEGIGQALGQLGTELKTGYERLRDALKS